MPMLSQTKKSFFLGLPKTCFRFSEKPRYSSYKVNPSPLYLVSPSGSFSESSVSDRLLTELASFQQSAIFESGFRLGSRISRGVLLASVYREATDWSAPNSAGDLSLQQAPTANQ